MMTELETIWDQPVWNNGTLTLGLCQSLFQYAKRERERLIHGPR